VQTPNLSGAQRSYMRDSEAFCKRMRERAEQLFWDGYSVQPGEEVGLFLVTTPTGEEYPINPLTADCACPFQQKAEIPQVPCKHLTGLEGLITEQLAQLQTFIQQHTLAGYTERAAGRQEEYDRLNDHWQATRDAQAEPDLPDAWDAIACAADRAEREVREAGFEEF